MNPRRRRHNRIARKKRRPRVFWRFKHGGSFEFVGPHEPALGASLVFFDEMVPFNGW